MIISLTSRQPGSDIIKLSRWLRCLFNISLDIDESVSLKCIDEVTHVAAKKQVVSFRFPNSSDLSLSPLQTFCPITMPGLDTPPPSSDPSAGQHVTDSADYNTKESERYPKTELEWLATTTFNRAVDYYLQEDDDKAKKWADKAFVVAQWIEDDGATRDFLMGKYSNLKFSEQ